MTQTETCSTSSKYQLRDIVDFCYANRKTRGFKDNTWDQIAREIVYAADNDLLHIVADEDGLCGVICCTVYPDTSQIFIHQIVCLRNGFRTLVTEWQKRFPDYTLAGLRNGELKTYTKRNFYGK